ncbi:hypothetical protein BaRGS_00030918 [Batillaria attramentaria]|uniref:Uncharacterized protein n=1 Tax=Batillaria attramentaria TaxID=370345 RepID=A0ABD0JT35_9CAEN
MQHNATQRSTAQPQRNAINSAQRNATQHSATQPNTAQRNSTQRNTTQHSATQLNTARHNPTQRNAAQGKATQHKAKQFFFLKTNIPTLTLKKEQIVTAYGQRLSPDINIFF